MALILVDPAGLAAASGLARCCRRTRRLLLLSIMLRSPAFTPDPLLPRRYSGDGEDVSPELSWSVVPPAAKELALLVEVPDAPTPEPWVHWVLYRIPPTTTSLAEHVLAALHVT